MRCDEDPIALACFPYFAEYFRQTNGFILFRIDTFLAQLILDYLYKINQQSKYGHD